MNKKSTSLFLLFSSLFAFLAVEFLYIGTTKKMSETQVEKKISFVQLSGLPDLAINSESSFVRHRSLSDLFSIFQEDGSLREHATATYAISHSHIKD
ncbi:MAG: hypothetical protein NTZ60_06145 [Campylobacterales bacterium]|nr:hypothetical protein [Campylobacterales bacterium]